MEETDLVTIDAPPQFLLVYLFIFDVSNFILAEFEVIDDF